MIFISYSNSDDEKWRRLVTDNLKFFLDQKEYEKYVWMDTRIEASRIWDDEIQKERDKAKIAILLVSDNFLENDYIKNYELKHFLERHDKGLVEIFWFPVSKCKWEGELGAIQCVVKKQLEGIPPLDANLRAANLAVVDATANICDKLKELVSDGATYSDLCLLNFKTQNTYFDGFLKSPKAFLSFVIRGDDQDELKWLRNKMVFAASQSPNNMHTPISIDLDDSTDISSFYKKLGDHLVVKRNQEIASWSELQEAIIKRIKTRTQVLIIRNAVKFIHSEVYTDFLKSLDDLNKAINGPSIASQTTPSNRCIFIFQELSLQPYQHSNNCVLAEADDETWWRNKTSKDFKFVDLGVIKPIVVKDMFDWLGECQAKILEKFDDLNDPDGMKAFIGNGRVKKVIPDICDKININYAEKEKTWLRY